MSSKIYFPQTSSFLEASRTFAENTLDGRPPKQQGQTTVIHHHHHDHWGSPFWGGAFYPQPVYVVPHGSGCNGHQNKDRSWLAIPVLVVALCTLFPAARNWAEWSQTDRAESRIRNVHREAQDEITQNLGSWSRASKLLSRCVGDVFLKQMELLDHIRSEARRGFFWKAVFFVSAIGGAAALATSAAALGMASAAGAATSAGAMIWRCGIRSINNEAQIKAEDLEAAVVRAEQTLAQTIDQSKLIG